MGNFYIKSSVYFKILNSIIGGKKLITEKISENLTIQQSKISILYPTVISSYTEIFPNFFENSDNLNTDTNQIDFLKLASQNIKDLQKNNSLFIAAPIITVTLSSIISPFINIISNSMIVKSSLLQSFYILDWNNIKTSGFFEDNCGENGGANFNFGGIPLPKSFKNHEHKEIDINDIQQMRMCKFKSIYSANPKSFQSFLNIVGSGNMGSLSKISKKLIRIGGLIHIMTNMLKVSKESTIMASSKDINNIDIDCHGNPSGGSVVIISSNIEYFGKLLAEGSDSKNVFDGAGAGGNILIYDPLWIKKKPNSRSTLNKTWTISNRAGTRPKTKIPKFSIEPFIAEDGLFYSSNCPSGTDSVFCSTCSHGFYSKHYCNNGCRKCPSFNPRFYFVDNECIDYICKNRLISKKLNENCFSGFCLMLFIIGEYFFEFSMVSLILIAMFLIIWLIGFIIQKCNQNKIKSNIEEQNKLKINLMKDKDWLSVMVSGCNTPNNEWFICISTLEKRFSNLEHGQKYLNIFRNLNGLFQWSFSDKFQYLLSFITQFLFLKRKYQFHLRKKKFLKASKYLKSLGERLNEYQMKLTVDGSINFCTVHVKCDYKNKNKNFIKSFPELILRMSSFKHFKYEPSFFEEETSMFLYNWMGDFYFLSIKNILAEMISFTQLSHYFSRNLSHDQLKLLLLKAEKIIKKCRKEIKEITKDQVRMYYLIKLADKSSLKFQFHSLENYNDETIEIVSNWLNLEKKEQFDCSFLIFMVPKKFPNENLFKVSSNELIIRQNMKQQVKGNLFNEIIFKKKKP